MAINSHKEKGTKVGHPDRQRVKKKSKKVLFYLESEVGNFESKKRVREVESFGELAEGKVGLLVGQKKGRNERERK